MSEATAPQRATPDRNVDFLGRLLMEKARLVAVIDSIDGAIEAYEALALDSQTPAIPPPGYQPLISASAEAPDLPQVSPATRPAVTALSSEVLAFAGRHDIRFRGWDDLRRVNDKRDDLGLPRFKRPFGMLAT
jgi:hypothetical protein